jgi:hypothetical protein
MDEVFGYFEAVSQRVVRREIPQVLILHANSLNADRFDALAEAIVRRGYRFIPLEEALNDDTFNHWEVTAGRAPVPTPRPSEWISKAAGGHSFTP